MILELKRSCVKSSVQQTLKLFCLQLQDPTTHEEIRIQVVKGVFDMILLYKKAVMTGIDEVC